MRFIIGHRGAGKTSWLKIIQEICRAKGAFCFDLDQEAGRAAGKTVSRLFKEGEGVFRRWEQKAFHKITSDKALAGKRVFIALGAGFRFPGGKKPEGSCAIWLRRPGDSAGRVFFDRPALQPDKSPFQEYQSLYKERDSYYQSLADEVFIRQEHFKEPQLSDSLFLGMEKLPRRIFALRLDPKGLPKEAARREEFLRRRLDWGVRLFELHDESASLAFIEEMRAILPEERLLFSSQSSRRFCSLKNKKLWSWDLSLGKPPEGVSIAALHSRSALPDSAGPAALSSGELGINQGKSLSGTRGNEPESLFKKALLL